MRWAAAEIFMFKIVNLSLSKPCLFTTFPPVFDLKIPDFLSYIGLGWFPPSSTSVLWTKVKIYRVFVSDGLIKLENGSYYSNSIKVNVNKMSNYFSLDDAEYFSHSPFNTRRSNKHENINTIFYNWFKNIKDKFGRE